jgi:ParB family transcriptional regulator, chromosome partitioning protein
MLERAPKTKKQLGGTDNEWYTPPDFIDKVREVLGTIDLDPASCPVANTVVKAKKFFTETNSGLTKPWYGKVFLNPPYQRKLIKPFVSHLLQQLREGNTTEAIVITHNCTDARWFHALQSEAALICFTKRRIPFWQPDHEDSNPARGQAVFYFGRNASKFKAVFSTVGFVR